MFSKLFIYTKRYPARLTGYISALIIWFHKYLPATAADLIVPSIIFIIGFAEWSQGVEDEKLKLYTKIQTQKYQTEKK